MKNFKKSSKLDHVCYDIRGPVMDEANRLIAQGCEILKLNIGNPAPFSLMAPEFIPEQMTSSLYASEEMCIRDRWNAYRFRGWFNRSFYSYRAC